MLIDEHKKVKCDHVNIPSENNLIFTAMKNTYKKTSNDSLEMQNFIFVSIILPNLAKELENESCPDQDKAFECEQNGLEIYMDWFQEMIKNEKIPYTNLHHLNRLFECMF